MLSDIEKDAIKDYKIAIKETIKILADSNLPRNLAYIAMKIRENKNIIIKLRT